MNYIFKFDLSNHKPFIWILNNIQFPNVHAAGLMHVKICGYFND